MKNRCKIASHICWYQMQLHHRTGKTVLILLLLFLYIREMVTPLNTFSVIVQEPVTPWVFSVLVNDNIFPFVITVLYLIWICDAPFINDMYLYLVTRCGKKSWISGEIIFLCVSSWEYTLACYGMTVLSSVTRIRYENRWGKVLGTLTYTGAEAQYPMRFNLHTGIMERFAPKEALIYTCLMMWAVLWAMGLCVFLLNWLSGSVLGTVIAFLFSVLDITITNLLSAYWYHISPVSMMRMSIVTGLYHPSFRYCVLFVIIMLFILAASLIVTAHRRKGV